MREARYPDRETDEKKVHNTKYKVCVICVHLARVFLTLSAVSRTGGLWCQHSTTTRANVRNVSEPGEGEIVVKCSREKKGNILKVFFSVLSQPCHLGGHSGLICRTQTTYKHQHVREKRQRDFLYFANPLYISLARESYYLVHILKARIWWNNIVERKLVVFALSHLVIRIRSNDLWLS